MSENMGKNVVGDVQDSGDQVIASEAPGFVSNLIAEVWNQSWLVDTGDAQYHMAEVKVTWNEIGALFNITGKYFCFDIYLVQANQEI